MSSVEEVVNLIEELYSPKPNRDLNEIQQVLQGIQKSGDGLILGSALLSGPYSTNVKYFGALTLAVQINMHHDDLKKEGFGFTLFRLNLAFLVQYFENVVNDPSALSSYSIVIKKLMSNLSILFVSINNNNPSENDFIASWNNPLNTLINLSIASSQMSTDQKSHWYGTNNNSDSDKIILDTINSEVPYNQLIEFISSSPVRNQLSLLFTEILVEDLTKFQTQKHAMNSIHGVVHEHLYISTMALIIFNLSNLDATQLHDNLFNCINAWINYISISRQVSPQGRMDLSELLESLLKVMLQSNENEQYGSAEKVISIFSHIFSNDPLLMNFELRSRLETIFLGVSHGDTNADKSQYQWMLAYMNYLVTNEMYSELKDLSICVCDFLQINTLDLCNKLFTTIQTQDQAASDNTQEYIKILLQLTNFPLHPVSQESFSLKMVDFWLDLAEGYSNLALESLKPNSQQLSIEIFQQVINIYVPKISLSNKKLFLEMGEDKTVLNEFEDFRNAVADLTQSLWLVLGNENLTNVLIAGVGSTEIASETELFNIETMSYLLEKLLKDINIPESLWVLDVLEAAKFLVANVQTLLRTGLDNSGPLSIDFVRSSTTLMSSLSGFYKENPEQIGGTIEILVQGLEKCASSTGGANAFTKVESMLVKTISTLCSVCRKELYPYLDNFTSFLHSVMSPDKQSSDFTRRSLTRSIGYIIQGQFENGPDAQGGNIDKLVMMFNNLIEQALGSGLSIQEKQNYIQCVLDCISELGNGLVYPQEMDDPKVIQLLPPYREYWNTDPLGIRAKIMQIIEKILQNPYFQKSSSLIEASCLILGKSLTLPEEEPYFLRYSMNEIINFVFTHLQTCDIAPALPFFVYLLENLFSCYKATMTSAEFDVIFERVMISNYHQVIVQDPDSLQTCVNFVNSILDTKPGIAVYSQYWTSFILKEFLQLLTHKEKFTIVAVTKFWAKVVNNKKYTREELEITRQQVATVGAQLTAHVMAGLYHTQRSDLNAYTELIRTLVAKFPIEFKGWLVAVLPQLVDKPQAHEKFINKLFITRGSRAAGNVILTWWLECSGLPGY